MFNRLIFIRVWATLALWAAGTAQLAAAEPAAPAATDAQRLLDAIGALEAECADYPAGRLRAAVEAAAGDADAFAALTRQALVTENPLLTRAPLLFVARRQYSKSHHNTHNFSPRDPTEFCEAPLQPGAALKTIDLRSGRVTTLLEAPAGVIRDPRVHWDGARMVFSMKKSADDDFHIYEINADGTGLRQLTRLAQADHLHPLYLPSDDIVFAATREPKYCQCNRHIMANIYRMEADGANIHQITRNNLFDRPTDITPDGRILYDRWEYVDRNFGDAQGLWTVNPDGTNQALYWGNNTPQPAAVVDARLIPGTTRALAIFSAMHDQGFGALAMIDRRYGMDGRAPVRRIWPARAMDLVRDTGPTDGDWDRFTRIAPKYQDPYPLSEQFFLVSRLIRGSGHYGDHRNRMALYLVDMFGHELELHAEEPGAYAPMPLAARPRPPVIPDRRTFDAAPGRMYVQDVYEGQTMRAVPRGTVRAVRVVEAPEKRTWSPDPFWHGQGGQWPAVNWHSHETKRVLGTAPVEADGSAYFEVPAGPFVYFQLLDEHGMMVHSMRSGTVAQPGETTGCIGCHEDRRMAPPPARRAGPPLALRRPPSRLEGGRGPGGAFNYMAEVQPIFDAKCVSCHDFGKPAGEKGESGPRSQSDLQHLLQRAVEKGIHQGHRRRVGGDAARLRLGLAREPAGACAAQPASLARAGRPRAGGLRARGCVDRPERRVLPGLCHRLPRPSWRTRTAGCAADPPARPAGRRQSQRSVSSPAQPGAAGQLRPARAESPAGTVQEPGRSGPPRGAGDHPERPGQAGGAAGRGHAGVRAGRTRCLAERALRRAPPPGGAIPRSHPRRREDVRS
jgi:hypothetical protein